MYTIYICDTQSAQILQKLHGHFGTWCMWCVRSFFILYKNLLAKFMQGFPYWGMGESSLQQKICSFKFLFPPTKSQFKLIKKIKTFLAVVIVPVPFLFVLISYSFKTQIMLILILIDVQYSQNAVFSFEKFSNCQNHSSSGSHHLVKIPLSSVHNFLTKSHENS